MYSLIGGITRFGGATACYRPLRPHPDFEVGPPNCRPPLFQSQSDYQISKYMSLMLEREIMSAYDRSYKSLGAPHRTFKFVPIL